MMLVLGLPLFASLLSAVLCADPPGHQHHRHLPDTAPDMDLKPAFQRSTDPPPHRHHSHDFSLPLPIRSYTTKPSFDRIFTTPYAEYDTEVYWTTMPDYDASGDEEAGHDHAWRAEGDDGRDSLNDHFGMKASGNKVKSTLLLVFAVTFLLIT